MYFVILSNIISGFLISIYVVIFVLTITKKFKNIENINRKKKKKKGFMVIGFM